MKEIVRTHFESIQDAEATIERHDKGLLELTKKVVRTMRQVFFKTREEHFEGDCVLCCNKFLI